MNCVAECEYCKSIDVLVDGESGSVSGHFCKKLNRLVQINRPIEEDCPFYFNGYSYKDLVDLKGRIVSILKPSVETFMGISWVPVIAINKALEEFDSVLNKDKNGN